YVCMERTYYATSEWQKKRAHTQDEPGRVPKILKRKERPRPVGRSRSGARLADKSIDLEAYSQQIAVKILL
ncbi:unnamed protein product, partial [Clavelina lepadiformis]